MYPVFGQAATATLSGAVIDQNGGVLPDATVIVENTATAFRRKTETNSEGQFTISFLPPGSYKLTVERQGFSPFTEPQIALSVGDQRSLRIQLRAGGISDQVVVSDRAALIDESPAVSTVVDKQFVENQPLNGRSFQTLIQLAPGTTITSSSVTSQGQFSANGQRTTTNYFTVDGVSANFGTTGAATLYNTAGGGAPAFSAQGGTNSLASVDAVEEFQIQTSTYAPEFGRQPGAQVSIVTRSGTNAFHGSVFDYVRNDIFDANDYFSNLNGLPKSALRQNDFGFTVGGPVFLPRLGGGALYDGRNRTFFFVSYEGLRLRQPVVSSPEEVPSLSARQSATGPARDLLNAFPMPNGHTLPGDPNTATFVGAYSNPSSLNATSVRIDHSIGSRLSIFGRYNYAPSSAQVRADFASTNTVADKPEKTRTLTVGATAIISTRLSNELRVNFSRAEAASRYSLDNFGGAVPPPASDLFPTDPAGLTYVFVGLTALTTGLNVENRQSQFNVVDGLSYTMGGHTLKLGFDYRRMTPVTKGAAFRRFPFFFGVSDVLAGNIPFLDVFATDVVLQPVFNNYSAFAQDTWHVTRRMTLTYGLRYEVNPSPSEKNGNLPLTVESLDNLAMLRLAPRGTRLYETTYNNLAPRFGLAYQLFPDHGTVIRGGFGVFYDLGYTFAGSGFISSGFPYGRALSLTDVPLASAIVGALPPPSTDIQPPFGDLFVYERDYKLPYTLQYNVTLEQALGRNDLVSLAYVGATGRRLGRVERLQNPNPDFTRLSVVRNAATSDYNALQLKYQRRLSRGVQVLSSYTWSKSIDIVSNESIVNYQAPLNSIDPRLDRGPSDFDVRHLFNGAVSWEIPSFLEGKVGRAISRGFAIDSIFTARSATPVNILTGADPFGLGFTTVTRPDVITGVPLYIDDPAAAGGRRINLAAFIEPAAGRQGTLGRNSLRGFPLSQLDLALRRQFQVTEGIRLQVRIDAFNILNHANFANPSGVLSNPNFGVSTQMLGRSLGGLNPLYQIGGPRSLQLAAKLLF
jgi:Carboxypeptidase regulatory-like domain/TonB dependent receptor/TonB-dependent Receptor Plug Domain